MSNNFNNFTIAGLLSTQRKRTMSLVGKTALVTGASRGIGLQIARALSAKGSKVVLMARDEALLRHNVESELVGTGHNYISFDVRQIQEMKAISKHPYLKDVNVLVHCAGISQQSLLTSTPLETIDDIITTNLTAPIVLTQCLVRQLIRNNPSSVVFLSSVLGNKGLRGTSVYSATKSGLQGFTRAMSHELGSKNVRFNSVSPGLVTSTQMGKGLHFDTVLNRGGVCIDEVVQSVLFLCENEAITGQNLIVDNGYIC